MNNRRTLIKRLLVTCGIVAWVGGMVLGYLSEGPWRTVGFALHIAGLAVVFATCFYNPPVVPREEQSSARGG
ncbi:hypothetical protein [Microbacterium testaceum]|uniref:hypothetical protein n=1 Tax=Microbacterium testaceum TaxID=2033 RepID=UPI0012AD1CEF|nr:hypothetical protein [Microbacterium testaceum]